MLRESMGRRMTREELSKVEFYRGDAVYMVLKRYEFSDAEKKIIQSAIVTAKRENPNISLIDKSDALLKMVATSREAVAVEVDELETKKNLSAAKMAGYKKIETSFFRKPLEGSSMYIYGMVAWAVLAVTLNYFLGSPSAEVRTLANGAEGHLKLYTFDDAQKLCSENGKMLPLTVDDAIEFLGAPDPINAQGFWSAEQEVLYNVALDYEKDDGKKHYVVCVDTNGKGRVLHNR